MRTYCQGIITLRNKGLETPTASSSGSAKLVLDFFGSVRTIPIVRASKSSVKVVRHKIAVFFCGWLWKSEEARLGLTCSA
jgi:hypothetical protein